MWATAAVPLVGSLGTVALVVSGGGRHLLIGLGLAATTLAALLLQAAVTIAARRRQSRFDRETYRRTLEEAYIALIAASPTGHRLPVRAGRSRRTHVFAPTSEDPRCDPVCVAARDRFLAAYATIEDAPVEVDLADTPTLRADRAHARALVLAATERHPSEGLRLEVHSTDPEAWDWTALLPHHAGRGDHRLIVSEGVAVPAAGARSTVVEVTATMVSDYTPDRCGAAEAAARARRLRPSPRIGRPAPRGWTLTLGDGEAGPVTLDIRESAEGGVGPHGLLVGATGSGKSELLRQLLAELVARHRSEDLRLALIDYKGGAAFALFRDLPHVAAYVTNLADSVAGTRRLLDALEGEVIRRQHDLAAAGAASIREHSMPRLLIVVDEFAELCAAEPGITELFARIGRLGRSLGIHLLLSTQRLEDGRLQGLEAHLSYRIALRTFTAAESRMAIGSPCAAELPPQPGAGVLAIGGELQRFRAPDPAAVVDAGTGVEVVTVRPRPLTGPTVLEDRVARAAGPPAPRLWLPPLDSPPVLSDLEPGQRMEATIGVIDRPRDQRIEPLTLDLSGTAGHIAVVGGPRSGKSTTLRTLAAALQRSTPDVRLLGLDLTGGLTGSLPPQRIASARTPERVERLLRHLRRLTERGASPPRVVLIDGWGAMRENYAWLDAWHRIAEHGLAADVHIALATHRWSDIRPSMRDLFGSRVELRLGDPLESEIDRRLAAGVPMRPGRGLIAPGYSIQLALDSPL